VSPYTTTAEGATNCSACVADYYRAKPKKRNANAPSVQNAEAAYANWECKKCPDGTQCGESYAKHRYLENLYVQPDYYRFSSTSSRVYECPLDYKETNCLGKNLTRNCADKSKGPLCKLCVENYFHDDDGKCQECGTTNLVKSLAPIVSVSIACVFVVLFFQLQITANFRRRVASWARQHRERIDWVLISMRLIFFDFQVLSKYSELQAIDW
jgi:hypothetical protein